MNKSYQHVPKILVVDDRNENLYAMREILSTVDAEIIEATSGQEALSLMLNIEFALVLLDVQMPDMDGFETAQYMQKRKNSKDIPIIYVTALHEQDKSNQISGYESGAIDFIHKPIDPKILRCKVNIFLKIYNTKCNLELEAKKRQQAEEEVKLTINAINDVIISLDQNCLIKYINPSGLKMIQKKLPDVIRTSIEDNFHIFYNEVKIDIDTELRKAIDKNMSITLDRGAALINNKGTTFTIEGQISLQTSHENETIGSVIAIHDIGEQLAMERALINTEKIKSLGVLAAGFAHEIRNPLGVMIQTAQNIERRFDPLFKTNISIANEVGTTIDNITNYIHKRNIDKFIIGIRDAGRKASNIVNQLISLTDEHPETRASKQISWLIEQSIQLCLTEHKLDHRVELGPIEIIKQIPDDIPEIICNPTDIIQAIYNILKNSAQALIGISQSPKIIISAKELNAQIILTIEDNGIGMEQSTVEKAFEAFFTTKPPGEGTGLGLTIVYTIIVTGHNGEVNISSYPGNGTIVTIALPIK